MKKITFPYEVSEGSVSIKIYKTPSHGCDSYTLIYWQDGKRKRPTFPTFEKAKAEADVVKIRLGNVDADVLTLTSADRAAYLRAQSILNPLGISIEMAAAQAAHLKQLLGDTPATVAADYYKQKHPTKIEPRFVKDVVAELLTAKEGDGLSARYLDFLRWGLGKFAGAFQCNIGTVSGTDIDAWLRGLGRSPRTRNNLRNAVQTLFSFAKGRRYLPKDHDELDAVARAKDGDGEIEIFTTQELAEILTHADERLIAFLTLGAFAGVRHAEIQRLDWKDIHFDAGIVEIRAANAKTASRRTVPLLDNLREWLEPHRQQSGPVCIYRNTSNKINRLVHHINAARSAAKKKSEGRSQNAELAEKKFKWKHNALRHSFISYRVAEIQNVAQVALEAGNSTQMIFKHYRELVRPADARTWFSIAPGKEGKVIYLEQKKAA